MKKKHILLGMVFALCLICAGALCVPQTASAKGITKASRVFNTCKWNNMAETAELRLFLCQVYKNLMLYGVVFHVKQWYNGGYETLV